MRMRGRPRWRPRPRRTSTPWMSSWMQPAPLRPPTLSTRSPPPSPWDGAPRPGTELRRPRRRVSVRSSRLWESARQRPRQGVLRPGQSSSCRRPRPGQSSTWRGGRPPTASHPSPEATSLRTVRTAGVILPPRHGGWRRRTPCSSRTSSMGRSAWRCTPRRAPPPLCARQRRWPRRHWRPRRWPRRPPCCAA